HGQLTLANRPTHEQEVADVDARDDQHEADDDHEERRAQADDAPAARTWNATYRLGHDRRQRFGWRAVLGDQLRGDAVEFGRCLAWRRVRTQAAEDHKQPA